MGDHAEKLLEDLPTLSELPVCQVLEAQPHLGARRLRRGLQQGEWTGAPWQFLSEPPPSRHNCTDDADRHSDLPTNFFTTCDAEYVEVSPSVDIKQFLHDPHCAFTAGLRKEVSVKNLSNAEREAIVAGKAKGRMLLQMRWVLRTSAASEPRVPRRADVASISSRREVARREGRCAAFLKDDLQTENGHLQSRQDRQGPHCGQRLPHEHGTPVSSATWKPLDGESSARSPAAGCRVGTRAGRRHEAVEGPRRGAVPLCVWSRELFDRGKRLVGICCAQDLPGEHGSHQVTARLDELGVDVTQTGTHVV